MAKVARTVTIKAPVDKVFSYISNPKNEMEFIPSITDIRDVQGQKVGDKYGWTYKMMGVSLKGDSEIIECKADELYVTRSTGGIISTWTWTFKPEGDSTVLGVTVDYNIPVPVLGKVGERMVLRQTEREADYAMENLKDILQA